jgi:hypothetical protein
MGEKDKEEGGVKVTDKRRFTAEGEKRPETSGEEGAQPEPAAGAKAKEEQKIPEIDFPTFILSLATSAQVHLGAVPNPATGKQEKDLNLAKQTIDILGLLQDKTKGNLSSDEERLLQHLLYDLRVTYVDLDKGKKSKKSE